MYLGLRGFWETQSRLTQPQSDQQLMDRIKSCQTFFDNPSHSDVRKKTFKNTTETVDDKYPDFMKFAM